MMTGTKLQSSESILCLVLLRRHRAGVKRKGDEKEEREKESKERSKTQGESNHSSWMDAVHFFLNQANFFLFPVRTQCAFEHSCLSSYVCLWIVKYCFRFWPDSLPGSDSQIKACNCRATTRRERFFLISDEILVLWSMSRMWQVSICSGKRAAVFSLCFRRSFFLFI